jgi:ribonuclease PH
VEVQSTAEAGLFSQQSLDEMLVLARRGIAEIFGVQRRVLDW